MPIGRLRERVTLQRLTDAADGYGGADRSWATLATVWARVSPLAGAERVAAMQLQAPMGFTVVIRYRADLTEADRVYWNGQAYNIRALRNVDEKRRYLALDCEAGVAA